MPSLLLFSRGGEMQKLLRSGIASAVVWASSVAFVSIGAYFLGRSAEVAYENLMTDNTPSLDVTLEEQGRYEDAIQAVLSENKSQPPQPGDDSRVALLYLEWAKRDLANRDKLVQESASYSEKAVKSAADDPFTLESAMDNLNGAGDYSGDGCPYYEEADRVGERAIALTRSKTIAIQGRNYPTQPIREGIEPQLKRIRGKIEAWCKKKSQ
jgi:hypothetical protein